MTEKNEKKMNLIEWNHVKHFDGTLEEKEIETIAAIGDS